MADQSSALNVIFTLKTFIKVVEDRPEKELQNDDDSSSEDDNSDEEEWNSINTNKCKLVVILEPEGTKRHIFIEKNLKILDLK